MPDFDDSLGGQTLGGDNNDDRFEKSLGDEHTMGGDTDVNSLGDASTMGDANIDDDWGGDDMELVDLSARYTEEGVLGKGGMGEVLLATDTRLDRKVAIKRILGKAARSKTASQRFLTEAKSIAALNHNNIVQIYDYGRSTEGPFLIMECVQGGSLLDKCKEGPIELEEAVNIFSQLCDGLAKAHAANIIHRDIKPANVLMTEDGVPKLTDFGLAKDDTADTGMTMEGAVIGTLDFMPPEQREGAHLTDHRSDLWSLAATFYQMLTGKSPKIIKFSDVPAQLQDVMGKALEDEKDTRFQSALEMKEAVQQAAVSGVNASRDLGEGECPECGTINPSDRKFCRNPDCAASLEVINCLSCKSPMPMWETVCGSCGDLQKPLIDEALARLQSSHDQAEQHLQALEFDKAAKEVATISGQTDLRLQKFASWHEEFTQRIEQSRSTEYERLKEILLEATAHEKAYDYEAGLRVLQQVAPSLLDTMVNGVSDTASDLKDRLEKNHSRLTELEQVVRERVTKREISGLLPIVTELLTLRPDRPEVEKLKVQLEKRDADQLAARDAAYEKASECITGQKYAEAVATLNTVSPEGWNEQLEELKVKASDLLTQLNKLRDKIAAAVNANELRGLLPDVEACLLLKSDQDDLTQLKADLLQREAQIDARNQQIIAQAQQLMQQLQFDSVQQILNQLALEDQTATTEALAQQAQQFSMKRQSVLGAVTKALSNNECQVAIHGITKYLSEISYAGLQDPQLQQMLDQAKAKESVSIRNQKLIKLSSIGAVVATVIVVGFIVKSMIDQRKFDLDLQQAIQGGDYEAVLALDPSNAEGLKLQMAAQIKNLIDDGDYATALKLSSDDTTKTAVVEQAIRAKDFTFVLEIDPNHEVANTYLEIKALLEKGNYDAVLKPASKYNRFVNLSSNFELLKLALDLQHRDLLEKALSRGDYVTALRLDLTNEAALELQAKELALMRPTIEFPIDRPTYITTVAFTPDGSAIAYGYGSGSTEDQYKQTIGLIDTEGNQLSTISGNTAGVRRIEFDSKGELLAHGSISKFPFSQGDGSGIAGVNIINIEDMRKPLQSGMYRQDKVTGDELDFCFAPDGKGVFFLGKRSSIIHDTITNSWKIPTTNLKGLRAPKISRPTYLFGKEKNNLVVMVSSFSYENVLSLLVLRFADGLQLIDIPIQKDLQISGSVMAIRTLTLGSDTYCMIASQNTLWKVTLSEEAGRSAVTTLAPPNGISDFAISNNGQTLGVIGVDKVVRLYKFEELKLIRALTTQGLIARKLEAASNVNAISFSPVNRTIAGGCQDGKIRLWNY